jgi:hypothetical protein
MSRSNLNLKARQAKEGCEDSNRSACEAGQQEICYQMCQGREEGCEAVCLENAVCSNLYPDACRRCVYDCDDKTSECLANCPTCEEDPDGLDCFICEERCWCANFNCRVDNCRPICESGPERASSGRALKTLFQRGARGSASFAPSRGVQSRTLNTFQPRTLNTWQPRTLNTWQPRTLNTWQPRTLNTWQPRTINTSRYGNRNAW